MSDLWFDLAEMSFGSTRVTRQAGFRDSKDRLVEHSTEGNLLEKLSAPVDFELSGPFWFRHYSGAIPRRTAAPNQHNSRISRP